MRYTVRGRSMVFQPRTTKPKDILFSEMCVWCVYTRAHYHCLTLLWSTHRGQNVKKMSQCHKLHSILVAVCGMYSCLNAKPRNFGLCCSHLTRQRWKIGVLSTTEAQQNIYYYREIVEKAICDKQTDERMSKSPSTNNTRSTKQANHTLIKCRIFLQKIKNKACGKGRNNSLQPYGLR